VKTDRRDARALADACRLGPYHPAHRTSAAQREVRAELTVREALVRTRTRYLSVIRSAPARGDPGAEREHRGAITVESDWNAAALALTPALQQASPRVPTARGLG
jgi:hypothetical protein